MRYRLTGDDAAMIDGLSDLVDAGEFSQFVRSGVQKLAESGRYQDTRSTLKLQERLRPLFCPLPAAPVAMPR